DDVAGLEIGAGPHGMPGRAVPVGDAVGGLSAGALEVTGHIDVVADRRGAEDGGAAATDSTPEGVPLSAAQAGDVGRGLASGAGELAADEQAAASVGDEAIDVATGDGPE